VDTCEPGSGCVHAPAPDGTSCTDGDACTEDDHCSGGQCVAGTALDCDDHDSCTTDSCDPGSGCHHATSGAASTFFSVRSSQFLAGMTVLEGDVLELDGCSHALSRVVRGSTFGGLGIDALDVRADGNLLFSVRQSGGIHHAGGFLHALQENVYLLDVATGEIEVVPDWQALGINVRDLDALDELADGSFAFSTATLQGVHHADGSITLRPQNVYRFDPGSGTLSLLFDGVQLGLGDIDAVEVGDDGDITISTKNDAFVHGTRLAQQNAYRFEPDGEIELRFDGRSLGLGSLDDLAAR
jgi:hypothetical protein